MSEEEVERPIIIKRIKKNAAGHHGGAWKVAYADFVTAMMAFFLLLWLLNVTTEEQLNAISDYFDPSHPKVSETTSGAGGVLGGLSMAPQGAMTTDIQTIKPPQQNSGPTSSATPEERAAEEERFKDAEAEIKQAIQDTPELASLSENLLVDMTPEGLRIQIVDSKGRSMFSSGSAQMYDEMKTLLAKLAAIIGKLPNDISVRGHTDSASYAAGANYTNWELSADRANSSRRVLTGAGLAPNRVYNVVGKADHEPLDAKNPLDPRNRRISIILLREELTKPPKKASGAAPAAPAGSNPDGALPTPSAPPQIGTFRKTPGQVEFP